MLPRPRTIALWSFLLLPFGLRELGITEPYPSMLMPSGAGVLNVDEGLITFQRIEIYVELADGSSHLLDLDKFFLPVPKHFLPPMVGHEFGLAQPKTKQLKLGGWELAYTSSPEADEEMAGQVRSWFRERAAAAGFTDATGIRVVRTKRIFDTKQNRESSVEILREYTIKMDG